MSSIVAEFPHFQNLHYSGNLQILEYGGNYITTIPMDN